MVAFGAAAAALCSHDGDRLRVLDRGPSCAAALELLSQACGTGLETLPGVGAGGWLIDHGSAVSDCQDMAWW